MSSEIQTLSFNLDGFAYAKSVGAVRRQFYSPVLRFAPNVALALLFLSPLAFVILRRQGFLESPLWQAATMILLFAACVVAAVMKRILMWRAVAQAPIRQGTLTVSFDEIAITISGPGHSTRLDWSTVQKAFEGPDGVLLLAGAFDFLAIPRKAFADKQAQKAFLTTVQGHISAARGRVPA